MMMWRYVVLEIYTAEGEDEWPEGGSPAKWIDDDKVGYCDGQWSDAVGFMPLHKLLWWKWQYWWARLRDRLPME